MPAIDQTGVAAVPVPGSGDGAGPSLTGRVLAPEDAGYDAARRLFNGAVDHRPELIAQVASAADVAAALRWARERGLDV